MDLTPEQIEELFTKEVPDVRICLHDVRITPINLTDGELTVPGYVARLIGHGADGKPMVVDFATTEIVLQDTVQRFIDAGMSSALMRAMDEAVATGDPNVALAALALVAGALTEDDAAETPGGTL